MVSIIKINAEEKFCRVTMIFTLYKNNHSNKNCIFFQDLLPYITSQTKKEVVLVSLPPHKFAYQPWYYWLQDNKSKQCWDVLQWHNVNTTLHDVRWTGSNFKETKTHMYTKHSDFINPTLFPPRKKSKLSVISGTATK